MASYREFDTGTFLQQFTNSVSRALHKQNCTCNGKTYTADELKLKSNPAIFAPNFRLQKFRHPSSVEPENGADAAAGVTLRQQQKERCCFVDQSRPRHKSEFEFEPPRNRTNPARVKKLGQTLPKKRPRKEADLPERLDVTDKSGQNWQIVHEFQKKPSKRSGRLKPLSVSQTSIKSLTPPGRSQFWRTRAMTIAPSRSDPEVLRRANHLQDDGITEQKQEIPEPNPSVVVPHAESCRLQVLEFDESPRTTCASSANHGTSPVDESIGDALNPTVQDTQNTHEEFLPEPTVLPPVFRNDIVNRTGNHNQTGRTMHMRYYMEGVSSLPSLGTNASMNHPGGGDGKHLPLELHDLYKRGGLKVSTLSIDMGGVLPENFLHRDKNKLRQMYPMYDWRVGHKTRELRDRYANSVTNTAIKEVTATASTVQLPATFPASHHENTAKDRPRFTGKPEWKRPSRTVRNERGKGSQRLDTVKEAVDFSEETAVVLEQTRVTETAMELRPNSSFFPRQPPPTPMDGRRNRTEEIKR